MKGLVKTEKQLARIIAGKLRARYGYDLVYPNFPPGAAKFRDYYLEWFGEEPLLAQPDVDILVVQRADLVGIELKYFRMQAGLFKRSYYEGIGQALALLRYGFDYVQLWHCFDQQVEEAQVTRFVESTWDLVYELKLPIGHVSLKLLQEGDDVLTKEIHVIAGHISESEGPPEVARFYAGRKNPLVDQREAKRMREFIQHVLRIPRL